MLVQSLSIVLYILSIQVCHNSASVTIYIYIFTSCIGNNACDPYVCKYESFIFYPFSILFIVHISRENNNRYKHFFLNF